MDFQPNFFNFYMVLNLFDIYQYHSPLKKKSLQNSTHNLNLKCICSFSYHVMYLFWYKYISCVYFKWKNKIQDMMSTCTKKKPNANFFLLWLQFLGGIVCFHPWMPLNLWHMISKILCPLCPLYCSNNLITL
jgi:hypothetical protein